MEYYLAARFDLKVQGGTLESQSLITLYVQANRMDSKNSKDGVDKCDVRCNVHVCTLP